MLLIKNLLFTIFIPGTVAVYLPLLIAHGRSFVSEPAFLIIGIVLILIGTVVYGWTVYDFAVSGKGTPLPIDAPRKLVVRGLYRYVRNPMYLGVLLVILGWVWVFADLRIWLYGLVVALIAHVFVVRYEEPHLENTFKDEYVAYKASVGRWLPRIKRVTKSQ